MPSDDIILHLHSRSIYNLHHQLANSWLFIAQTLLMRKFPLLVKLNDRKNWVMALTRELVHKSFACHSDAIAMRSKEYQLQGSSIMALTPGSFAQHIVMRLIILSAGRFFLLISSFRGRKIRRRSICFMDLQSYTVFSLLLSKQLSSFV